MNVSNRRFALTALATVFVIAVLLFGGAGVTAYAAQSALPGDALYSLKTGIEQTQISLSRDAYNRAELQLSFAERRLDEIAALISNGRFNNIGRAVQEFESHVQSAISELQTVAAGDPTRATELASRISTALSRYALTLSGMVDSVPEAVRPEMERAIFASQGTGAASSENEFEFTGAVVEINPEAWVVGDFTVAITTTTEIKGAIVVGDMVKVHAYEDASGVLTAREIELVVDDQNANTNTNENAGNDNENVNGNTNSDDNINDNLNGNSNDDNENTNSNLNSNNNNNHNDNTNSNSNNNSNDNSNDNENDNENHNSNLNSNDNHNDNTNNNGNVNYNGNANEY